MNQAMVAKPIETPRAVLTVGRIVLTPVAGARGCLWNVGSCINNLARSGRPPAPLAVLDSLLQPSSNRRGTAVPCGPMGVSTASTALSRPVRGRLAAQPACPCLPSKETPARVPRRMTRRQPHLGGRASTSREAHSDHPDHHSGVMSRSSCRPPPSAGPIPRPRLWRIGGAALGSVSRVRTTHPRVGTRRESLLGFPASTVELGQSWAHWREHRPGQAGPPSSSRPRCASGERCAAADHDLGRFATGIPRPRFGAEATSSCKAITALSLPSLATPAEPHR